MRGKQIGSMTFVALVGAAWLAFAQGTGSSDGGATVATVGSARITRKALSQRASDALREYERRLGSPPSADLRLVIERQALESLIRAHLLVLEAERRKIPVSSAETDAQLKRDPFFQDNGRVVEERFQKAKTANSPEFQTAVRQARQEIAGRKLHDQMLQKARPEEAHVRAVVQRALTRATVEYLPLRFADFTGDYPEPRESEVIAYQRAHASEFRREGRAKLTVLLIDEPAAPAGASPSSPEYRAWETTLRERADGVLAAIAKGATLEEAASGVALPRREVVVLANNFPGFWRGTPALNESVFRTAPGRVIPEPIPANPGWLIARVDQVAASGPATLAEAAPEIRERLRSELRHNWDERHLRSSYEARKTSLSTVAFRLRYAIADTATFDPGEPTIADLDRYYRGHQADYTTYDAATGAIRVTPLADVKDDVRARWKRERRVLLMRATTERLADTWGKNRRDRGLERGASEIRERGPVPEGALIDSDEPGRALTDTLAGRGMAVGVRVIPFGRGNLVVHVYERIAGYVPTFEQALPELRAERRAARAAEQEEEARQIYERNPRQFAPQRIVYFSRLVVEPPPAHEVPLTRKEVERWLRDHIDRYSAPEVVVAKHILVSPREPGAAADAEARKEAEELLRRVRAGEDFAELARRYSDDPATREKGGDLGAFGRGVMLDRFEQAAFSMQAGDVSDLVHTEVGYHIIKVTNHLPLESEPLERIYVNVGIDAATDKGERIVRARADSLLHVLKTPAQAQAAAAKLKLSVNTYTHPFGKTDYPNEVRESIVRLENQPPGKIVPASYYMKGVGAFIEWVDSVGTGPAPSWEDVRARLVEEYLRDAGRRAIDAKRAELDSLHRTGWSVDSLAALWGGFRVATAISHHDGLPELGGAGVVDSLVFGGRRAAALDPGEATGWIELPAGLAMLRLRERHEPAQVELAARMERERRLVVERQLYDFFFDLKTRYPVRILDESLRSAPLPPIPEPTPL